MNKEPKLTEIETFKTYRDTATEEELKVVNAVFASLREHFPEFQGNAALSDNIEDDRNILY